MKRQEEQAEAETWRAHNEPLDGAHRGMAKAGIIIVRDTNQNVAALGRLLSGLAPIVRDLERLYAHGFGFTGGEDEAQIAARISAFGSRARDFAREVER